MTPLPLPERASLEQLKKQAKNLLKAAQQGDRDSLARFPQPLPTPLALHDAQLVLAREHGFPSWNRLRQEIEERALSFAAAADEFVRCATGNAPARALRLLERHPAIAHASLFAELVLGNATAVEQRLKTIAPNDKGGPQNWPPLLYVCHSCLPNEHAVDTARVLLDHGADPNAEYDWNWHAELPRTALWGALIAMNHRPLAELLLARGARATDGVSMHLALGGGNLEALELLVEAGADVNGIPGGLPPLRYAMGWARDEALPAFRWLLEHGADPNLAWEQHGDAPLHLAAQRWPVPMVELLAAHGADLHLRRRDGRNAHAVAALNGNCAVADWLLQHGVSNELTDVERFVADCTAGRTPTTQATLTPEHHLLLHTPAEKGQTAILETMLTNGFDPNARDHDGVTPLHRAAMAGHPEAAKTLLKHGADLHALDGMFAASPLVWAAEGWSHHPSDGHLAVARVLLDAGSSREWQAPEKAPDPERTQELLIELCRAAER